MLLSERREQSLGFPHRLPSICCQEDYLKDNLAVLIGNTEDSTEMNEGGYVKVQHLLGTDVEITVTLGSLELCSVIGETEAHRTDTCKAVEPRNKSQTDSCFIMVGLTLPKWSDLQTPMGPSLNGKILQCDAPHPDLGQPLS